MKINFEVKPNSILPINYQYELSSWIYKVIARSDIGFSEWLHQRGYRFDEADNKRYKLFSFSKLFMHPFKIQQDTIISVGNKISLMVAFCGGESVQHFVTGLFQNQCFDLGTKKIKPVSFTVTGVEVLPKPAWKSTAAFKATSPICISMKVEGLNTADYLKPSDAIYKQQLLEGLVNKYEAATKHFDDLIKHKNLLEQLDWTCTNPNHVREKLITIKANTAAQTRVKGYAYDFELVAPASVLEFVYYAGMGTGCSQGFGWLDLKKN